MRCVSLRSADSNTEIATLDIGVAIFLPIARLSRAIHANGVPVGNDEKPEKDRRLPVLDQPANSLTASKTISGLRSRAWRKSQLSLGR